MSIQSLLWIPMALMMLLPGLALGDRLKQPGLVGATVETSITEVEKLLIRTGLEKGIELSTLQQIVELVRSNMIKVGHNPRVLDAMVAKVSSPTFLGTTVDGVFMLRSIADIARLSDPEEASASAAGTAVGYLGNVAGNVAVASALSGSSGILALGGGFLPGVVVSLSAKAVTEMTTEAFMLYYDRQNAAYKERWAAIALRENAIRGLLKVNNLLKSGKLDEAAAYLTRVQIYLLRHHFPKDGIHEQVKRLQGLISQAEDRVRANRIIAMARIPFQQAYRWALLGRNLTTAKRLVQEASTMLTKEVGRYPELQAAIDKCNALQAYIDQRIAQAPPLGSVKVSGPNQVQTKEYYEFDLEASGGLPDYQPLGMYGTGHASGAKVYWQAPEKVGKINLLFRVQDDRGQRAEVSKLIEVIAPEPTAAAEPLPIPRMISIEINGQVAKIDVSERKGPSNEAERIKQSMFQGFPGMGSGSAKPQLNLSNYRQTFNNEGRYEVNGSVYKGHIRSQGHQLVATFSPPTEAGANDEATLVLTFDPKNPKQLTGFKQGKYQRISEPHNSQSTRMSLQTEGVPFTQESGKSIQGGDYFHYRFEGDVSSYLVQCEYENLTTNQNGTFGMKWGRCDPSWKIYIGLEY